MMKDHVEASKSAIEQRSYQEAVRSLNQLQSKSNYATSEEKSLKRDTKGNDKIKKMLVYLNKVGIQEEAVNQLKVIHITGTKGKGSTCAFCESILRSHGYKTGLYSSPHLIEVRERMRINGKPISSDAFSHYYWQCYDLFHGAGDNAAEMPTYFQYLTVMAFKVFRDENVDVAIVEVGIGGRYDCTNFISKPVACGVTSLGLDHVGILGDTVEKIAWQKGGIFKEGAAAITVPDQPGNSEEILRQCATKVGVQLQIAPLLDQLCDQVPSLSLDGRVQQINAALAVQLVNSWLSAVKGQCQGHVPLPKEFITGLQGCHWPGRNHVVRKGRVTYYLDGAHTLESILQCADWFDERSASDFRDGTRARVLLFNLKGNRSAETLLKPLLKVGFDAAVFCPNLVTESGNSVDQTNHRVTSDMQLKKSEENCNVWITLNRGPVGEPQRLLDQDCVLADDPVRQSDHTSPTVCDRQPQNPGISAFTFPCIKMALQSILSTSLDGAGGPGIPYSAASSLSARLQLASQVQVLVTGSLHLVGGVLAALEHPVE